MPTITKSIGTSSRDYSTITAWEADLDNTTPYDASDDAVGECYNDSAFDETVVLDGGTTIGLATVRLSVAAGHRHTGVAGTGARIVRTGGGGTGAVLFSIGAGWSTDTRFIEWLDFNLNGQNYQTLLSSGGALNIYRCLIHGLTAGAHGGEPASGVYMSAANVTNRILNCIVYALSSTSNSSLTGIRTGVNVDRSFDVINCTVHGVTVSATVATGMLLGDAAGPTLRYRNNVAVATTGGSGPVDFSPTSFPNSTVSNNASSDGTATGSGSLTSISSSQFVSTVGGSEDFHLKADSVLLNAGVDLVTTPSQVNLDIDNYDRDATGVAWDIGADEYVQSRWWFFGPKTT